MNDVADPDHTMISRRLALTSPLFMTACAHTDALPLTEGQHAQAFRLGELAEPMPAWLYLPRGYAQTGQAWPLVVFLHGSGERGTELDRVKVHGPPKLAANGTEYPFILVSPQLADGRRWEATALHALLAALQSKLRIDPARITATGLSLGGHGVWEWATAYPRDLAGIAPVCGFGEEEDVCRMRQVPVRAYHGAADDVVPLAAQKACVDALRACGGAAELIVFPGVGHDAWNPAYADPALVPWLMARKRA
jgi:predicted peptidase